jgi:hypothetical protein
MLPEIRAKSNFYEPAEDLQKSLQEPTPGAAAGLF